MSTLTIRDYEPALAEPFYRINAEWISTMFTLEDADRESLRAPFDTIIAPGGVILFAERSIDGRAEVVGTAALMKSGPGIYELTKMGVLASARGLKVGEALLQATLERAKSLEPKLLYLLTNRKCEAAIHLYEKNGFVHDTFIMEKYGAKYARCNVAMRYLR